MTVQDINGLTGPGAKPSFVQRFVISGLFGYRTLSLSSDYAATILIARNGAGKTTMLGALDAFLRGQFGRLADLTFDRIECKLRDVSETFVLRKEDLDLLLAKASESASVHKFSKALELDPADIQFFVLWEYPSLAAKRDELLRHPIFSKIFQHPTIPSFEAAENRCRALMKELSDEESPVIGLRDRVIQSLINIEIVYLPTYRRIELSLPQPEDSHFRWRPSPPTVQSRLGLSRRGLHAGDIQFGLADISARLKYLHQEVMSESNQKYAEISANIIDDLISGAFENQNPSPDDRPTSEELSIFFSRMKEYRHEPFMLGPPYRPPNRFPDFNRIYSGNVPQESEKFLTYFLGKLNRVIKKTRETEQVVVDFVANCNRYLSGEEPTTNRGRPMLRDAKELKLDRAKLEVSVWRKERDKEIPLDALSSGEKQMVSLFARLDLYPRDKLVLIDEPELSLSLDWQRKILPDILNSATCRQVIAITHSPFIFDNELDPFAKGLNVDIADVDGKEDI